MTSPITIHSTQADAEAEVEAPSSGGCGCGGCGCGGSDAPTAVTEQQPTTAAAPGTADATPSSDVLDVRSDLPPVRHERIFGRVGALEPGEQFVLVNDHDPKPLRYQLDAEEPGQITWEYLEQGPEVWQVRIGRVPGHCC